MEPETSDGPQKRGYKFYGILAVVLIIILAGISYFAFFLPHSSGSTSNVTSSVLASESRGTITKEVLIPANATSNDTSNKKTLAIITGMHPREKLSIASASDVISQYNLSTNEEIIHYAINITDNPDNYVTGRSNGECMVAQYIIPDIKKSDVDMVIVCHDHGPGYGRGYYIATPKMDSPSVAAGELIEKQLPEFTYYRSSTTNTNSEHGSSTLTVSYPLANAGIRTLVYEMPEWAMHSQAYDEDKKLFDVCFSAIPN